MNCSSVGKITYRYRSCEDVEGEMMKGGEGVYPQCVPRFMSLCISTYRHHASTVTACLALRAAVQEVLIGMSGPEPEGPRKRRPHRALRLVLRSWTSRAQEERDRHCIRLKIGSLC